jgi:transcriptional regulator with XRE-family HTH domain
MVKKKIRGVRHADVLRAELQRPAFAEAYFRRRAIHEVATVVKQIRIEANLTQASLAKAVRTSQPTIARLEKGLDQRLPRWDMLNRIALATGRQLKLNLGSTDPEVKLVEVVRTSTANEDAADSSASAA